MARLTPDQWAAIREEWETDPKASYDAAAQRAGDSCGFETPTKAAVHNKAKAEGWAKHGQLADIGEAAQRRADRLVDSDGAAKVNAKLNGKLNGFTAEKLASRTESEILRAEVLVRHRKEWAELDGLRKTAFEAMQTAHVEGDKPAWQIAKLAADTAKANLQALEAKQQGERRAWGLNDIPAESPSNVRTLAEFYGKK